MIISEDDCLALLSYVSKNRNEAQSLRILEEETGVPREYIRVAIHEAQCCLDSDLSEVAERYGFEFKIFRGWNTKSKNSKRIIDVVKRGYY